MVAISANDLKIKGVKAFTSGETLITVRGKEKYVVLDIETYDRMRDSELEIAYKEVINDFQGGNYTSNVDEHMKNIDA